MPIAEALSLGVPVVANRDCPASAWLLKEGHLGTLCGSAPKEVADGLDLALSSTAEKQAEGQRAVHALCNPSRVLELYEEAYQAAKKRYSGGS